MIDLNVVDKLKQKSVAERIQIIELILQSLKDDMKTAPTQTTPPVKPFKVKTFNLGDVKVEREELYGDRGL